MSHSIYAPSNSERWIRCPGSIELERKFKPPDIKHESAVEGSLVHSYIEKIFKKEHVDLKDNRLKNYIFSYFSFLKDLITPGFDFYIEKVLSFENIVKGGFGTADCVILGPGRLKIVDFKYGYFKIQAKDNYQLMMYALAALNTFKIENVSLIELYIYQPRISNVDKALLSIFDLLNFKKKVIKSVMESREKKPVLNVTQRGCAWCPVRLKCSAFKDFIDKNILNIKGGF